MGSIKDVQMITALGKHGPYSFYKSIKIGERTLSLSSFFPVKIWPDSTILSIAEIQLLWSDKTENFCSLRLYFLPENTPEGRRSHHGEDEVIALQDKVIIRASDLSSWLVDESDWHWGFVTPPSHSSQQQPKTTLSKAFLSEKFRKNDKVHDITDTWSEQLVVLNYVRYSRLRGVLKRLEGSQELSNWLSNPLVLAIGGRNIGPNSRLLFAKEVFDYPELEDHELLCNHLAPKLKGRPRKGGRRRNPSLGSESNESETSSAGSRASDKSKKLINGIWKPKFDVDKVKGSPESMHPLVQGNGITAIGFNSNVILSTKFDGQEQPESGSGGGIRSKRKHSHSENSPDEINHNLKPEKIDEEDESESKECKNNEFGQNLDLGLAEKLDKSNVLQISRPSVITPLQIQETPQISDSEVPRNKKMKTEPGQYSNHVDSAYSNHKALSGIINNNQILGRSIMLQPGQMDGKQNVDDKHLSSNHNNDGHSHYVDKKHAVIPNRNSRMNSTNNKHANKLERHGQSPSFQIDKEFKRIVCVPLRFCSPSPFISTLCGPHPKIYGDPVVRKAISQQQPEPPSALVMMRASEAKSRTSGINNLQAQNNDVLDFSSKKGRVENLSTRPSQNLNANVNVNSNPELLDLSAKAGAHNASGNNIFHNLADIPPPNAMNKLGLRLTSEVTLFPSHLGRQQLQQPQVQNVNHKPKRERESSSSRGSSGRNSVNSHVQQQQQLPPPQMGHSNHRSRHSNANRGSPHPGALGRPSTGSGNNTSKLNSLPPNPHVWRPISTTQNSTSQSSSQSSNKAAVFPTDPHVHHSSAPQASQWGHYTKNLMKASPPLHNSMDRPTPNHNSQNSHSRGSSSSSSLKVSQQLAVLQQQERAAAAAAQQGRERENREKERERAHEAQKWGYASVGQFLPPSAYQANPYMPSLFGGPLLPPTGLMSLPPGALEQFQLYKDLLIQQGLPPHFPAWPPPQHGNNHNTKDRGSNK